jgi:hypothetical protein
MNLLKQQLILQMQECYYPENYNLDNVIFELKLISDRSKFVKHLDYLLDDLTIYYSLPYEDRERFLKDVLDELINSSRKIGD